MIPVIEGLTHIRDRFTVHTFKKYAQFIRHAIKNTKSFTTFATDKNEHGNTNSFYLLIFVFAVFTLLTIKIDIL
jgi:hypothetical protein